MSQQVSSCPFLRTWQQRRATRLVGITPHRWRYPLRARKTSDGSYTSSGKELSAALIVFLLKSQLNSLLWACVHFSLWCVCMSGKTTQASFTFTSWQQCWWISRECKLPFTLHTTLTEFTGSGLSVKPSDSHHHCSLWLGSKMESTLEGL